jgi:hypothetical protein
MKIRTDCLELISSLSGLCLKVGLFSTSLFLLAACDSVQGYPQDSDNSTAVIASFDPSWDADYSFSTDSEARRRYRDLIVLNRMRTYDIAFDNFERGLYGQGNSLAIAGSLATITMGAVGGVAGAAVTKAALNVASGAVTGAEGAISKELYYQRTLPALISQMEANRTNAKVNILAGIKEPDSNYPLVQAYVDLEALKAAGGIPLAISNVTQAASTNQQLANAELDKLRDVTFTSSSSISVIEAWLQTSGPVTAANLNLKKLVNWMNNDKIDLNLAKIPVGTFLSSASLESDRQRAIRDLHITSI